MNDVKVEQPTEITSPLETRPGDSAPKIRMLSLDILRAVAVLLVIGRHLTPDENAASFWHIWKRGGWIGVDLFFVLSGFLVSGLLFREYQQTGSVRIGRFLVRRGFKIYPAYYAFLLISTAMLVPFGTLPPDRWLVLRQIVFLQNYARGLTGWDVAWGHTWSLAVEEHFYILASIAIALLIHRSSLRRVPAALGLVAMACLILRLTTPGLMPTAYSRYFQTQFRLDSLGFGMFLAYYWHFRHASFVKTLRPVRWGLLLLGTVLLSPAFIWPLETTFWIQTYGLTLMYLGSGAFLSGVLLCRVPENSITRWIGSIGSHSYSIYLWHMPVIFWLVPVVQILQRVQLAPTTKLAFAMSASVTVGVLFARLIEFPVLRLRDRWYPSRCGLSAGPVPSGNLDRLNEQPASPVVPNTRELVTEVA
jgi:peptidoglycan/LPS O-acetylase OafA/YrhL